MHGFEFTNEYSGSIPSFAIELTKTTVFSLPKIPSKIPTFLANWHGDKFGETPNVCFSGFDIQGGSYEHLELLERCYKEKKMIDEFEPVYDDERIY